MQKKKVGAWIVSKHVWGKVEAEGGGLGAKGGGGSGRT